MKSKLLPNHSLQPTAPAPRVVMPLAIAFEYISAGESIFSYHVHCRVMAASVTPTLRLRALRLNCYVNVKLIIEVIEYTSSDYRNLPSSCLPVRFNLLLCYTFLRLLGG